MMGSLAYSNPDLLANLLISKASDDQSTVLEALSKTGYLGSLTCGAWSFEKFIELHIEQGPILENEKIDIGVVEGVQAIHWKRLSIKGKSAHAGTTPIAMRRDAYHALSCLSRHARELCESVKGLLITIGSVQVFPNVINVIPEKVIATIDLRHTDDEVAEKSLAGLSEFIKMDKSFRGLSTEWESLVDIAAVKFDPGIVNAIKRSCDNLGYSSRKMISGAGHDAQLLSSQYPSAMIFIPSKDGISHAVDEYSSPEQIEMGANVLLNTFVSLDTSD